MTSGVYNYDTLFAIYIAAYNMKNYDTIFVISIVANGI